MTTQPKQAPSFYIASRLENAERVRKLKQVLEARGWLHSYDWTVHGSVQNAGASVIREVAVAEANGVTSANLVIVMLPGGRGTHAELGMAIAADKHVIILSESSEIDFGQDGRTCAFYHHPVCQRVTTLDELLECAGFWYRSFTS